MKIFVLVLVLAHPAFSKVASSRLFKETQFDNPVLAKRSATGHCYANGDPHYTTFDNKQYNFMGTCNYVHVTDYCGNNLRGAKMGQFRVVLHNHLCGRSVSCINAVDVTIGGETIHLKRGSSAPANSDRPDYSVNLEGGYVVVRTKPAGLTVKWDMNTVLSIDLDGRFRGKVCGLCGNFDGNAGNDYTMSNGVLTSDLNTFAKSWVAGGTCGTPVYPRHPCEKFPDRRKEAEKDCKVIKSNHFASCKDALDLDVQYNNCVYDVCAGTTVSMKDSSCESIKTVSMMCKDKTGKAVSWGHLEQKCNCQRKAKLDFNGQIECCVFPFENSGVTFYDCVPQTTIGKKPWCSSKKKASYKTVGVCL